MNINGLEAKLTMYLPNGLVCSILNEFLESNVCIPKGENRHTDADVIHAYAEGLSDIEVLRKEGWIEFKQGGMCLCIGDSYRIKPSEPVYAYIWYRECTDEDREMLSEMEFDSTTVRMTEEELAKSFNTKGWIKIEATKKERK